MVEAEMVRERMNRLGSCIGISMNLVVLLIISIAVEPSTAAATVHPSSGVFNHKDLVDIAGYGEERLSSVLVAGSLLCDACLDGKAETRTLPISGARVAIKCKVGMKTRKSIWARGRTDEYGDFIIHLPSHIHAIPRLEKVCFVKVLGLPKNSPCGHLPSGKPRGIRLSSVGNGIRTYTPGKMRFQPLYKGLRLCVRKERDGEREVSW